LKKIAKNESAEPAEQNPLIGRSKTLFLRRKVASIPRRAEHQPPHQKEQQTHSPLYPNTNIAGQESSVPSGEFAQILTQLT
jgi:hypothetical protein